MSYMRGDYYLWVGGINDDLHVWVKDGYDEWDHSGWAASNEENEDGTHKLRDEMKNASGVSIPQEVMDEYVVMRMAELIGEGKAGEIIDKVVSPHGNGGNGGGVVLTMNAEKLKSALEDLIFELPPKPKIVSVKITEDAVIETFENNVIVITSRRESA